MGKPEVCSFRVGGRVGGTSIGSHSAPVTYKTQIKSVTCRAYHSCFALSIPQLCGMGTGAARHCGRYDLPLFTTTPAVAAAPKVQAAGAVVGAAASSCTHRSRFESKGG